MFGNVKYKMSKIMDMIVQPPKTLEDWQEVRNSICELMGNPYCDHLMFMSLFDRRDEVDKKIEELEDESK